MPDIAMRFGRDMLVAEGAMGTMLQREGLPAGECPEFLNVLDPEMVLQVHRYYHLAGAQCAISNTFGGTRAKLREFGLGDRVEELNMAGVEIAKQVRPEHVLADVGPCGLVMEPLGDATFEEVFAQYFEQVSALAKAQPDAILIETMIDIADARCALLAATAACNLPVIVSCTFNEQGRMELSGTRPSTAAIILEAAGASAVGLNCGMGPEQLYPLLREMASATELPLIIQPNAGMPSLDRNGNTVYPGTADEMVDWAIRFRQAGAQIIGSCCGSTPAFTGAIAVEMAGLPVVPRKVDKGFASGLTVAGPRADLALGPGQPVRILGERINPTGKPALAEELAHLQMSTVRRFAADQQAAGADFLDVNVGAPGVDEKAALVTAVKTLVGASDLPLCLDTANVEALQAALRVYPGRALINSCNGEESSYSAVLPLAKRYGAAVVVLALDENGIPDTAEERMAIIERVRDAAHRYGLRDCDLVVDMLTMTAAADAHAPQVTLAGVKAAHDLGLATILGVSNVSHGLPDRPLLNAAFVDAAVQAGLDIAIANPNNQVVAESVRVASDAREGSTRTFEEACVSWDAALERAVSQAQEGVKAMVADSPEADTARDARTMLFNAILQGDADGVAALVDEVVAEGVSPQDVISGILTPAINQLGDAFGKGEAFLPQLMVAADAMKAATGQAKTYFGAADVDEPAGTVVFCTVKGDIHSIGKDICISLLEAQGFEVHDLGVDTDPEEIVRVARETQADCVCLSALMTTTLPSMEGAVKLVSELLPTVAVVVGGAVVTQQWAQSIGARYSSDASTCVESVRACVADRAARS